jgi:hypothetical protein
MIGIIFFMIFSMFLMKNYFVKYDNEYNFFYYDTSERVFENINNQAVDYDNLTLFQPYVFPNTWESFSLQYFWQRKAQNQIFKIDPHTSTTLVKINPQQTLIVCNDLTTGDSNGDLKECEKYRQSVSTSASLLKLSDLIKFSN